MGEGERQLMQWIALGGISLAIWQLIEWIREATPPPNPWGPEIDAALTNDELPPSCHFCSAPLSETGWFCPGCGRSIGPYNNYSPYLYAFSLGEMMQRGTLEPFRVNWLTVAGYLLLSIFYFSVIAPIYWVLFFLNLSRQSKGRSDLVPGTS
jgi:hypothetical protein